MIDTRASSAAIVLSITGAAGFLIMPVVLGAAVVELQLSESQVGFLASMLMAGSVISAISAMFWVRTVDWRHAARLALLAQGVGLLLVTQVDGFALAAVLFLLVSLGGGAVYSLAMTVLSDHVRSERMFGYSITGQVAFQVLGLLFLGLFTLPGGFDKLMLGLTALVGVGLALASWLPRSGRTGPRVTVANVLKQSRATSALFGCLFFFFNVGCIWAYIERIGNAAGFAPEQLGTGLAIGVSVGMLGSLTASWQGTRFGHIHPLSAGTLGTIVSVIFLRTDMHLVGFMSAVAVYNFFWNYSLTYQYAVVAAADRSGRCVAVTPAFHAAGGAIGPAVAALLLTPGSFLAVNLLAMASVVTSMLLFVPAARGSRQA